MADESFLLFWEDGGDNHLSFDRLERLPFDMNSWVNFLAMRLGRRTHAAMTVHAEGRKIQAKVLPFRQSRPGMTFENIA